MVSSTVTVLGIAATGALLLCSAFFSSAEIAIFSLPPEWGDGRAETNDGDARTLRELRTNPHRLLVTLLVGNNVVNIAISSIVTILIAGYLSTGIAVLVTTAVTSLLVLVCGEIVPKAYGLGNAESWSLRVARPVRLVEVALSPLITVLEAVTSRINAWLSADPSIEKPYLE